eukprot:gene8179-9738_t
MDYILNTLTDVGLRRLYKFVLKMTIGKYLEDELLIDQLEVKSRDGVVTLRDINFNAQIINEEFLELLPVKIVSISISKLDVHLSYKTLLTDSCRFVVEKLDIVLAPNEVYYEAKGSPSVVKKEGSIAEPDTETNRTKHSEPTSTEYTSQDGQQSLSFIANWIEVVVARLQVQLGDVNITFRVPAQATSSEDQGKSAASERRKHKHKEHSAHLHPHTVPAVAYHDLQLRLKNIHYFNDDPRAYEASDASSIALSTKLTTSSMYNSTATAVKLGARKVLNLESIELVLLNNATLPPSTQTLRLIRLSSALVATVKLDHSQRATLRGIDVNLDVPNLVVSVDLHSAKCLCTLISAYLAITATETTKSKGTPLATGKPTSTTEGEGNVISTKSVMQRVLMSDPTLRTLFWLEEEENRKKKKAASTMKPGGRPPKDPTQSDNINTATGGDSDGDIDYARIAQLMRQYRTTRTALGGDPTSPFVDNNNNLSTTSNTGNNSHSGHALLNQSAIVESDSEGDFPESVKSTDDEDGSGSDSDSVNSADFFDTIARKPVTKVKMGESRKGSLNSSISGSKYGGASSRVGESGLFQSTISSMHNTNKPATTSSSINDSTLLNNSSSNVNVYSNGFGGASYAAASVQTLTLSAKLHIGVAEVVFTDLKTDNKAALSMVDQQVSLLTDASSQERASVAHISRAVSSAVAQVRREELCLHLEECVFRVNTVYVPPPPAPSAFSLLPAPPAPPRSSISISISVGEVGLYEQYTETTYRALKQYYHTLQTLPTALLSLHAISLPLPKQVLVSFHNTQDARRIYASPHINVSVEYTPGADKTCSPTGSAISLCASIDATVALEPIVASTSVAQIERWIGAFVDFPMITVSEEESTTIVKCKVDITQLELFLHADNQAASYHSITARSAAMTSNDTTDVYAAYWDTVLEAMNLSEHPDAWQLLPNTLSTSPYKEHLVRSRGGFRFLLSEICVKLSTSARNKSRLDASLLNSSGVSSSGMGNSISGKRSADSMLQSVEMNQVALYAYVSIPSNTTASAETSYAFYNTLLVRALADVNKVYKVVISKVNPNESTTNTNMHSLSTDSHDDFVHLRSDPRTGSAANVNNKTSGGSSKTASGGNDAGPAAPAVNKSSLIYVSAYHIQVDIKQREYNVLMMIADTIAPFKPPTHATTTMPTSTATSSTTASTSSSSGFGFVLSSKLATICLSDNEPNIYNFPELDELLSSANTSRTKSTSNTNTKQTSSDVSKTFSICVSIIEPAFEVLIANKDIYISVKADDLGMYEMELPQFRTLLQSGFDFNQTTGREARYGPNRHLVPFIRRASLHALNNNNVQATSGAIHTTLLGDNLDYGKAFEFRLLLSSSGGDASTATTSVNANTTANATATVAPTEVKSVHFFIDFYDIMLSYDPQSTWVLSMANILTPLTAAQILRHRSDERLRVLIERYNQLSLHQRSELGVTLPELVSGLACESGMYEASPVSPEIPEPVPSDSSEKKARTPITLTLPFELTKVNARVRDCIIDFCCAECQSRTFLTIGLLTVTSTIVSNSDRFSLKFKVGGLSLYISDILPLPTVQQVNTAHETYSSNANLTSSFMRESQSGYKGGSRYKKNNVLFAPSTKQPTHTNTSNTIDSGVVYDVDIKEYLLTHHFVDLCSVDHIDVLVTINNSEFEDLVISLNIGLCTISACVDSLDLFARTMKEWFREFQVACERSEQVMQKTSKPVRQLQYHSGTRSAGYSGGIEQEEGIDSIRFCDVTSMPNRDAHANISSVATTAAVDSKSTGQSIGQSGVESSGTKGRTGTAANKDDQNTAVQVVPVLPASMLEDVPLSVLLAQSNQSGMQGGVVSRNAAGTSAVPGGVILQSVRLDSTAHSDMGNFLVEDYYGGNADSAGDSDGTGEKYVGLYEDTNKEGVTNAVVTGAASADTTIAHTPTIPQLTRQDSSTSLLSTPNLSTIHSPRFVAQYDYDDTSYDQDYNNMSEIHEAEGVGGFYSEDHVDSGIYDTELEEIPEDDIGGFEAYDQGEGEGIDALNETDDHSVSVKSILLDEEETLHSSTHSSASHSTTLSAEENTTGNVSKSVFGMNNFALFGRPAAEVKKSVEDVELTDFNPTISSESQDDNSLVGSTTEDLGITSNTTTAVSPTVRVHYNHTDTTIPVSTTANPNLDTINSPNWLSQELGASTDGAGMLHLPSTITASTYNTESFELSDTEEDIKEEHGDLDLLVEHTEQKQVSYEADFGEYDDDEPQPSFVPSAVAASAEAPLILIQQQTSRTQKEHQPLQPRNSDLSATTEGNEGWQRFSSTSDDFFEKETSPSLVSAPLPALLHPTTVAYAPLNSTTASTDPAKKVPSAKDYTPSQAAAVFDDLDRAWMQEQTDFVYDQPIRSTLPTHVAKPVATAQTGFVAKAIPIGLGPSVSKGGTVNKTAAKPLQSIEAAQWYQNPDQLEIMPHYIPVVSRTEDLDDHRPGEEKSLHSKMLLKLRGTFKVRLFQGSDWPENIKISSSGESNGNTKGTGASNSTTDSTVSGATGTASATNKNVRFRNKEDLLRDLTSSPASTSGSVGTVHSGSGGHHSGHNSSSATGRPPAGKGVSSHHSGVSGGGGVRSAARTSRPLFEETIGTDAKATPDSTTSGSTTHTPASEPAPHLPRDQRQMLDSTFKDLFVCVRVYDNSSTSTTATPVYSLPTQRVVCSTQDFLVSFGKVGMRRKKVLGSWISLNRPRDNLEPVLRVAFLAYESPPITNNITPSANPVAPSMEHRLYIRVLPLRCYLDEDLISFAKSLVPPPVHSATPDTVKPSATEDTTPDAAGVSSDDLYFQSVMITAVELKIDYRASSVSITALHGGDYLQLLNIFPLDGLEITLKHVKLHGLNGVPPLLHGLLETWVKDIYANQLHRVISGTAPFRGLSNIGSDLHELLAIPLRDHRKSGGTMKHLRRSTETLVRTVTRETLHATQQITMFVASALSELASDSPVGGSGNMAGGNGSGKAQGRITNSTSAGHHGQRSSHSAHRAGAAGSNGPTPQPANLLQGLEQAYGSVSREVASAAETVIAIPIREYVHTGPGGYLKSVIRAFPIAVLRPVAGVMEGVSYTMLGLRNNLDPEARIQEEDMWNVDIGAFPTSPTPAYSSGLSSGVTYSVHSSGLSGGSGGGGNIQGHVVSGARQQGHHNNVNSKLSR